MDIYRDIEQRTGGEIYMGVVGPVRTGKSTFIKRFMEQFVIPAISDDNSRIQANDELPQSASGKMIMTTEPKFIPKEAVVINISDEVKVKIRMIDSVGYMINEAIGHEENGIERMVKTPWFDYEIPFSKASEIGTKKVIFDHSTVGIVITSDGSITDIDREAYVEAEKKTIDELNQIGKPYIVILNTRNPMSEDTIFLANDLSKKYNTNVLPINCDQLSADNVKLIFENLLLNFPISTINYDIPKWVEALDIDNEIKNNLICMSKLVFDKVKYMKDIFDIEINSDDYIEKTNITNIDMADGSIRVDIKLYDKYYYEMLSALFGCEIKNEYDFIREIKDLSNTKNKCLGVSNALIQAHKTGYGSVTPDETEIKLEEPELIKSGNKYGVKIKAMAPSIHLIKANISTEIAPIVGSKEQALDLISYIKNDESCDKDIWGVNIFGKTIRQLVDDGLKTKINKINHESQQKLQDSMEKIVNDSNGGMVCIII